MVAVSSAEWLTRYRSGGQLPSPRGIFLEALRLLEQEDIDSRELGRVLQSDPATNARLLQLANVSLHYRSRPIVAVNDAILVLGQAQIKRLVLALALIQSTAPRVPDFDYSEFWTRSLLAGLATQHATAWLGRVNADEIFVVTLLSKVGRLALASLFPESYGELLTRCVGKNEVECRLEERRRFDVDQDELSALLLEDWGLPSIYVEAVLHQGCPEELLGTPDSARCIFLAHLLRFGNSMAAICLQRNSSWLEDAAKLRKETEFLGLSQETVNGVLEHLLRSWPSWRNLLQEADEIRSSVTGWEDYEIAGGVEPSIGAGLQIACIGDDASANGSACSAMLQRMGLCPQRLPKSVDPLTLSSANWDLLMVIKDSVHDAELERLLAGLDPILGPYLLVFGPPLSPVAELLLYRTAVDAYETLPLTDEQLLKHLQLAMRRQEARRKYSLRQQRMQRLAGSLVEVNRDLRQAALTDPLTKLRNRRYAEDRFAQEWAVSKHRQTALGVMLLDLDNFKEINDSLGHDGGDGVLHRVARILEELIRQQDVVCRMGGDEFLVLCPETELSGLEALANRICERLSAAETWQDLQLSVSVSIGVACRREDMEDPQELIKAADQALFAAKQKGRNQVVSGY